MIRIIWLIILMIVPITTFAHTTISWDRTADSDMKDYLLYRCDGAEAVPCMPNQQVTAEATVLQPASTVARPSYQPGPGKSGWYCVSARDQYNNESVCSVSAFFDSKAPAVPANLRSQ